MWALDSNTKLENYYIIAQRYLFMFDFLFMPIFKDCTDEEKCKHNEFFTALRDVTLLQSKADYPSRSTIG